MITLKHIKDEVAKKYGHNSWSSVKVKFFKDSINGSSDMEAFMNEVCNEYANQKLYEADESAFNHYKASGMTNLAERAKQSILALKDEI